MKGAICLLLCFFFIACSDKEKQSITDKKYFDLEGYFKGEASRLQKQHPNIEKTVSHNCKAENKALAIADWQTELELFAASDINKPAWRDSYQIKEGLNSIEYVSTDADLRTQRILITKNDAGLVSSIVANNKTDNALYSSTEELTYIPDSLYLIRKEQHVILIGANSFSISARFGNR